MLWILLLVSSTQSACPTFQCTYFSDDSTDCAKFVMSKSQIFINQYPCNTMMTFCKYSDLISTWHEHESEVSTSSSSSDISLPEIYANTTRRVLASSSSWNSTSGAANYIACKQYTVPYTTQNINETAEEICTNKDSYAKKKLASGEHLKECSSDQDCLLLDGTYGSCVCSTVGRQYCTLQLGDTIAADAIDAACNKEYTKLMYYLYYVDAFIVLINSLNCFSINIFEQIIYEAQSEAVSGSSTTYSNNGFILDGALISAIIILS
ncbi:unnamed protein product [Blepharisma stoltei]|uniref:EGF-like domain-containing protein n=1 Tax=Blepharisma stoltei TaxID=1481888 RepID=A0AAU9JP35_9CILI|nr:unnamed protein product [Blepharisma stoltei]